MRAKIIAGEMVSQCPDCKSIEVQVDPKRTQRQASIVTFNHLPKKKCFACVQKPVSMGITEEIMNKEEVIRRRNELKKCPCCNAGIEDRTISLNTSMVQALYAVCKWCTEKDIHEFETRDVKHLWSKTQYATFGDLVWFGGLIYKNGKANYGINLDRARAYFKGDTIIPLYVTLNQITNEIVDRKEGKISEVKNITEWLDTDNKLYNHKINPYVTK